MSNAVKPELSDKEKTALNKKIRDLYFNTEARKKHKTLKSLLLAAKIENAESLSDAMRTKLEQNVRETVTYLGDLQYQLMEKTGRWGEYGQQRVVIGYARLKLNISPENEITQGDIDRFIMMMNKRVELKGYAPEQLKKLDEAQTYDLFGKKIKLHRSDLINRELKFLESDTRISVGKYGEYRSMIYGSGKNMRKEGYDLILFEKEIARTPTNIMSIAAVIGNYDIGIRREVCHLIFAMKWKKMFEYSENEKRCMYNNEAGNIREMIKVRALEAYQIKNIYDVEAKRELFIDEMIEGILWHEFGHGIFFNEELALEDSARAKAFNYFGENIVGILHEVLADWAPRKNKLKGPMQHFLEVAEKDPDKANRMLLVYMSDNWFLDYKEEFLGGQTDLMISVLMPFLNSSSHFDFSTMRQRYQEIYDFMLSKSQSVVDGVIDILKKAIYKPYKDNRNFEYMEQEVYRILNRTRDNISEEAMSYRAAFWTNMLSMCQKFSQSSYRDIIQLLKFKEKQLTDELLLLIEPEAVKYKGNIREFLFTQMKQRGFYKEVKPLTALDGIRMAIEQIGVFEGEREKVMNSYKEILEKNISRRAVINYDESFNFFNCTLQEMLLTTQVGEIDREHQMQNDKVMFIRTGQTTSTISKETIEEKIDELASLFNERKVLTISMLKVNTAHEPIETWYKLLAEKTLKDGSLLIQKIDYVTGELLDKTIIVKYRVPVEYGYMCFNTVNAIQKINVVLRDLSGSGDLIDKALLEYLTMEYNNTY